MKRWKLRLDYLFCLSIVLALAVILPNVSIPTHAQVPNNILCNQSVAVSFSSATTTRLVNNASTSDSPTRIFVCRLHLTVIGTATANTITFNYGTGATCGTGTTALSGPFTGDSTAGVMKVLSLDTPFQPVPVGNSLCATTTQAGVIAGTMVYSIQ